MKKDFLDIAKYRHKKIFVFVSHFHQDHYDRKIFEWQAVVPEIQYILSDDVTPPRFVQNVHKVHFDKKYGIDSISIETFHSTDEGVAFLVNVDNKVIYHAGDLNWWHWKGESEQFNDILALDYMLKIVKVKQVFPMHFWEKYSIYEDIPNQYREIVVPIHHTNELFLIEEDY